MNHADEPVRSAHYPRARYFDPNRQYNGELRPYLTMEYFSGENLQVYRNRHPEAFGLERLEHTLKVAREIAKGLHAAHQKQVIHRDIKPANILYRADESGFDLRIIDFGLAQPPQNMNEQSMFVSQRSIPSQQDSLLANTIAGTLKYAPPEQLGEGGVVGPHSDVYSWGRTLNYLLFGRTDPRTRDIRRLSEELQDLLDDCLEASCEKRLEGFAEVIRHLSECLHRNQDDESLSSSLNPVVPLATHQRDDYSSSPEISLAESGALAPATPAIPAAPAISKLSPLERAKALLKQS